MIEVANMVVRSFDLDHLDISWELISGDESPLLYNFYILRSIDGPGGPFRQISRPLHNTYRFRDPDVHLLHRWRGYYYRIKVENKETGESKEFGPQWMRAAPDRLALEIQRREQKLFKQYNGRLALLFPVLTFGQRCGNCYDIGPKGNTIGRSKQQNCLTCFDTKFVGGYSSPIRIYINIDPSVKSLQKTDTTEMALVGTSARLSCFPPVKPKDMIVEAENKRWRVEAVTVTEKHRAVVRQNLTLHALPPGHIRYRVPVNLDLFDTEFTPEYDFVRPMSHAQHAPDPMYDLLGGA